MSEPVSIERDGDSIVIRIPMQLKKRAGRKEMIVPNWASEEPPPPPPTQVSLVKALARAHRWQGALDRGRYESVTEMADALRVDRSYLRRILSLTSLAPDIVEDILAGNEPSGVSMERLVKEFPLLWEEQRKILGFPER